MDAQIVPEETPHYTARELRALELVEARGNLIRTLGGDRYEVPSCTTEGRRYIVRYGGSEESCECADSQFGHTCKHLLAVGVKHAARRSGIKVKWIPVVGDPFVARAKVNRHPLKRKGELSEERRAQMRAGLDRMIARAEAGEEL